jgi:hypothetical protein
MKIGKMQIAKDKKIMFNIRYPAKKGDRNKIFSTMKEALDFAYCQSEMITQFDEDIRRYAVKINHRIMTLNLCLC